MEPQLITFTKFNDIALAYQLVDLLKEHNIEYILEEVPTTFDPAFRIANPETKEYIVKAKNTDFVRIHNILDNDVTEAITNAEDDYYLFEFTDDELLDVLAKRDEWNSYDVLLARKILADRGKTISDSDIIKIDTERLENLRKPEKAQNNWIIIGYIVSFFGGVLGIFIGWHLWLHTKTLPNGEQVFEYNANDRKHGKRIFFLSIIIFALFYIAKLTGIIFGGNN